jgi:hypothetical protein
VNRSSDSLHVLREIAERCYLFNSGFGSEPIADTTELPKCRQRYHSRLFLLWSPTFGIKLSVLVVARYGKVLAAGETVEMQPQLQPALLSLLAMIS